MKSTLVLLFSSALLLLALQQSAYAQSNSAEAQGRKHTCGDLVKEKPDSGEVGASGEVKPSPQCVCSGEASPSPKPAHFNCELIEALKNISLTLTVEQQFFFEELIEELQANILVRVDLTDIEKVVQCSLAIKHFCADHEDIHEKISFQFIGSWGYLIDFLYVEVDLQSDIAEQTVTLDADESCPLFEAMLNATEGDSVKHSAVLTLIEELKVSVLLNVQLTYAQKLVEIEAQFELFFEMHADWKSFFLQINIEGFGALESLLDVCHGYKKATKLYKVIGGPSSSCPLIVALMEAEANASLSLTVRANIKQLRVKLAAFFDVQVDIDARMTYISQQCWQLFQIEQFIVEFLDVVSIDDDEGFWGIFYDILWCSQFCHKGGNCGNLNGPSSSSAAPSTAAPTTAAPTTVAPHDCSTRASLIAISQQNTTVFTDVIATQYASWNTTVKMGFNSCYNQLRNDIWNMAAFPTPALKINDIIKNCKAYNANDLSKQAVLMNISLTGWAGTIGDFCNCGNA